WNGHRLSTHPAGHVLGSAMLLVETEGQRLLYTGDFKLSPSATAAPAAPPRADVLVMESTFGDPAYRLPAAGRSDRPARRDRPPGTRGWPDAGRSRLRARQGPGSDQDSHQP